jgi:hypothetical protein
MCAGAIVKLEQTAATVTSEIMKRRRKMRMKYGGPSTMPQRPAKRPMPEPYSCWWCGATKDYFQVIPQMDEDPEMHSVVCTICGAAGPQARGESNAIEKWNEGPKFMRVR